MVTPVVPAGVGPDDVRRLYRSLRRIRRVEEAVAEIYPTDRIKSPIHLSIGQEAVSVGVIDVLGDDDVVSGSYRGHAVYLAKGADLKAMIAEMYGKATGCAAGKGGSMHLIGMERNVLGASAVVGTHIPVALGHALAAKREGGGRVVAVFFGDGATEEGVFHESLNFAALHRLPILFVCENNFFAIHTPLSRRWATDRLCERVATYGMPAHRVTGPDIFALRDLAAGLVAQMRAGGGPAFLECHTWRWREHVGPAEDYAAGYRARSEMERWEAEDQVARLGALLPEAERAAIDAEIEREIADAFAFAEASPFPDEEELFTHVFA
jgi:TPP-dependent pyruvate/acetoin dehydrogenase alpha subunit